MSRTRDQRKARERESAYLALHGPICSECGQRGSHFMPPSLGEPGRYVCAAIKQTESEP